MSWNTVIEALAESNKVAGERYDDNFESFINIFDDWKIKASPIARSFSSSSEQSCNDDDSLMYGEPLQRRQQQPRQRPSQEQQQQEQSQTAHHHHRRHQSQEVVEPEPLLQEQLQLLIFNIQIRTDVDFWDDFEAHRHDRPVSVIREY